MNRNLETLRRQRDELYQDARSHPDSDADQMVQILLLSAMSSEEAGGYDENLGAALVRERRGYRQARAKRAQDRRGAGLDETAPAGAETAGGDEGENFSPEMRLEKIAQALQEAEDAAESGQAVDSMVIYNKIAEVIGLRPYSPQAPDEPNAETGGLGA
jgi:hypothetical protein